MIIQINGESKATDATTIAELLAELGLSPTTALVEHNQTALHRGEWNLRKLSENDRVEILRVSAGG